MGVAVGTGADGTVGTGVEVGVDVASGWVGVAGTGDGCVVGLGGTVSVAVGCGAMVAVGIEVDVGTGSQLLIASTVACAPVAHAATTKLATTKKESANFAVRDGDGCFRV